MGTQNERLEELYRIRAARREAATRVESDSPPQVQPQQDDGGGITGFFRNLLSRRGDPARRETDVLGAVFDIGDAVAEAGATGFLDLFERSGLGGLGRRTRQIGPSFLLPSGEQPRVRDESLEAIRNVLRTDPRETVATLSGEFRQRPLSEQLALGLSMDPFVGFGGVKAVAKAAPFVRGALRGPPSIEDIRRISRARVPLAAEEPVVKKVLALLSEVDPDVSAITRAQRVERRTRTRQFGKETRLASIGSQRGAPSIEDMRRITQQTMGGELEATRAGKFPTNALTPADMEDLNAIVYRHDPRQALNNHDAFRKTFLESRVPEPADLRRLEDIFGPDVAKELIRISAKGPDAWDKAVDVLNVPRSIMASFDLSAPLRQGVVLAPGHPKEFTKAFAGMVKATMSEKNAVLLDDSIRLNRNFDLAQKHNLFLAERAGVGVKVTAREEQFMSSWVRHIPFVRVSERAYVSFLNKFRHDIFYKVAEDYRAAGLDPEDFHRELEWFAKYINWASGRGPLPKQLSTSGGVANALLFSPRLLTGRVMAFTPLVTPGVPLSVRKIIAKDLIAFVGTGLAITAIAKMAGAETNGDPLDSDFGKIRIGDSRMDIWGGHVQIARFGAQLMTRKRKTSTGNLIDQPLTETLGRFLTSKLAPGPGALKDIVTGRTFLGEELRPEMLTNFGTSNQIYQRLFPFAIQDLVDAIAEEGFVKGALLGAPAFFGVGIQTYNTIGDVLDAATKRHSNHSTYEAFKESTDFSVETLDKINNDPEVIKFSDEFERAHGPELSTDQQLRDRGRLFRTESETLQETLDRQIRAGRSGERLRKSIQEFKSDQAKLFQHLMSKDLEQLRQERRSDDIVLLLRDRYWGSELPENDETGELDFAFRDLSRAAILLEAKSLGIDPEQVTSRNPGRFRGFPMLQTKMLEYEDDMETLRPYWQLPERVIRDKRLLHQYRIRDMIPRDEWSPALRRAEKLVTSERRKFRRRSRRIDQILLKWGYTERLVR